MGVPEISIPNVEYKKDDGEEYGKTAHDDRDDGYCVLQLLDLLILEI